MCSLTETVAIRGGGIHLATPLNMAWIVKPTRIENKRVIQIYTRDYKRQQYFENNSAMVNHIT